jgi:citrate synthase
MSTSKLVARPGEVEFPKGLEGVIASESVKSLVMGNEGKLYYLGIPIQELAEKSTFEEIIYMLLYDRLPTKSMLEGLTATLADNYEVPGAIYQFIQDVGDKDHPMGVLRTAVSMLSAFDPDSEAIDKENLLHQAVKLNAKIPALVAAIGRARKGLAPISPRPDLSIASNFLYMLHGEPPDEYYARVMDVILIILADHGANASTFTGLVATSSETDMISSVVAAIGSLKGRLHGGANERVVYMLNDIGTPEQAKAWITEALDAKQKVMGFGHRVYKTSDPRATVMARYADEVARRAGTEGYLEIAKVVVDEMVARLGSKGIYPNVDYYSGVLMASMGIDPTLFTPIFVLSRVSGWTAHILEQRADNRLFRPRFVYTGPELESPYTPTEERS